MKIGNMRYLEFGKPAPDGSRFKGVINTESLLGYADYSNRDEAKDEAKEITKRDDGYFGYGSSHHKGATATSHGLLLDDSSERELFREDLRKSFSKKGNIYYEMVISLESYEEAERCGIRSIEDWNSILLKALPDSFDKMGFKKDNMMWWADYHINTENPHIHLVFLEKQQTITRGKIPYLKMSYLKREIFKEISLRKDLEETVGTNYKSYFKEKDLKFDQILTIVDKNILCKQNKTLKDLIKVLPKSGRMQYNSYNMRQYRPIIDDFIKQTINNDPRTSKAVDDWLGMVEILNANMNATGNEDIATIKEEELKKLYERFGNKILQYIKNPDKEVKRYLNYKRRKYYVRTIKHKYTSHKLSNDIRQTAAQSQRDIEEELDEFYRRNRQAHL